MPINEYKCIVCESEYEINFDEEKCESNPTYCVFCGDYILEDIDQKME
jgi:hypothetical protein